PMETAWVHTCSINSRVKQRCREREREREKRKRGIEREVTIVLQVHKSQCTGCLLCEGVSVSAEVSINTHTHSNTHVHLGWRHRTHTHTHACQGRSEFFLCITRYYLFIKLQNNTQS